MSANENIDNTIDGADTEDNEPKVKRQTYELVEERNTVNLEPLNEQISNLTKLLKQLVSKISAENAQPTNSRASSSANDNRTWLIWNGTYVIIYTHGAMGNS